MPRTSAVVFATVFAIVFASVATSSVAVTWDDLRTKALNGNDSMRQADLETEKSSQALARNQSGYLPSLQASYSKTRDVELKSSDASTSNRLALTASQDLFSGFATVSSVEQSKMNKVKAEATKANVSVEQRLALKKLFNRGLYLQDSVKLSGHTVTRRAENVRIVNLRYSSGLENKSSTLKTQALQELAEADLKYYQSSLELLHQEFISLMGQPVPSTERIDGNLDSIPTSSHVFDINQHPRLLQVNAARDAAASGVAASRAGWLPSLTADASAYRSGLDHSLEPETHISLGLTLSVPLFKPGQNADYREATIDWKKAEISITETRRTLEIQAQKASLALNDAATRKNIALKVFEAAKLQAEVYRNRYTLGMISFQDWNSAETEFIESERKLLDAKYAFADAWADMDAAYGKGLEVAGL